MLTKTVDVQEAQTNLKELLFLALKGIEVVLTGGGIPLVRLAPIASQGERILFNTIHQW